MSLGTQVTSICAILFSQKADVCQYFSGEPIRLMMNIIISQSDSQDIPPQIMLI